MIAAIFSIIVIIAIALVCAIVIIKNMLYICQPNEVLIFSGSQRRGPDERLLGYRIIKGGRGLRIPLFERVHKMDLTNMAIEVIVRGAFSKGGIPLNVQGVANVKVAGTEPTLNNAIERFLGRSRHEIQRIAQETLEGNLRGVLATLTPEQVNEDKISFAQSLQEEADQDLRKLGLTLDMMKVQNVSDDVGYLDSIGRKQSAEVRKLALIAEATSRAEATVREAQNKQRTEIAQVGAQFEAVKAEMQRRIIDATTKAPALVAEQESVVTAAMAKAEAEVEVQTARVVQAKRQLEADVIEPAKANQQRAEQKAQADAAKIVEDGAATAEALREVTNAWKRAGSNARDIFLLQKLDAIMKTVVSTIDNIHIGKITIIDGNNGAVDATKLVAANEQLKAALGVDIPALVARVAQKGAPAPSQVTKTPPA